MMEIHSDLFDLIVGGLLLLAAVTWWLRPPDNPVGGPISLMMGGIGTVVFLMALVSGFARGISG